MTARPVLVIAPHPDDEVLGCGGTIARLTDQGFPVTVLVVSADLHPLYPADVRGRWKRKEKGSGLWSKVFYHNFLGN